MPSTQTQATKQAANQPAHHTGKTNLPQRVAGALTFDEQLTYQLQKTAEAHFTAHHGTLPCGDDDAAYEKFEIERDECLCAIALTQVRRMYPTAKATGYTFDADPQACGRTLQVTFTHNPEA
jgi:hypothetical protein